MNSRARANGLLPPATPWSPFRLQFFPLPYSDHSIRRHSYRQSLVERTRTGFIRKKYSHTLQWATAVAIIKIPLATPDPTTTIKKILPRREKNAKHTRLLLAEALHTRDGSHGDRMALVGCRERECAVKLSRLLLGRSNRDCSVRAGFRLVCGASAPGSRARPRAVEGHVILKVPRWSGRRRQT